MGAPELWIDSYQGEVFGEAVFAGLAEHEGDPERRHQLEVLTRLERRTKELAERVLARRGLDRGDSAASLASARRTAEAVPRMSWDEFMQGILVFTVESLEKYHQLVELAPDDVERAIAEAYVAHEEALAAYARRSLGQEAGEPLELILALPHLSPDPSAGALAITDTFLATFNAADAEDHARTLAYPHIRLAGATVRIWPTLQDGITAMQAAIPALQRAGWDHSRWDRRRVVQAGEDKVHLDVQFSRFRADSSLIGTYEAIYVVVATADGWRIQCRSSFAP